MNRRDFLSLLTLAPAFSYAKWDGMTTTPAKLKGYVRTNWSQDPFSLGSYSYLAKGSGNADRITLAEPIQNRVFFAGEALNPNYQSTTHAAYESAMATFDRLAQTTHDRIAVVGAGISGIAAAKRLSEIGKKVTVLEGRNRIGGRILTDRSMGVALDLGATWIHGPNGNPISALADQVNLKRIETDSEYVIRGRGGKKVWSLFAPNWLMELESMTPTGTELNTLNLEETEAQFVQYGYGYQGTDVKFPNGYDEIFRALSGDYEIKLSTKVTHIDYSNKAIQIGTEDNQYSEFDAVIVTVPLGVLKNQCIKFQPALPQPKRDAIARMGMGTLDKLYLKFERPFWDTDATVILMSDTGLPKGQFNYWINFYKYLSEPILMAFNSGQSALTLSHLSDQKLIERALKSLARVYSV